VSAIAPWLDVMDIRFLSSFILLAVASVLVQTPRCRPAKWIMANPTQQFFGQTAKKYSKAAFDLELKLFSSWIS
jgi:hypothetical protein